MPDQMIWRACGEHRGLFDPAHSQWRKRGAARSGAASSDVDSELFDLVCMPRTCCGRTAVDVALDPLSPPGSRCDALDGAARAVCQLRRRRPLSDAQAPWRAHGRAVC